MKTLPSLAGCCVALLFNPALLQAENPVIVHEWGTFTCLQDEHGQAIGGINVDDEPVPFFIYGGWGGDVVAQYPRDTLGLPPYSRFASKAGPLPSGDPSVSMRLETPVVYFYPPKGKSPQSVPPLDVHVDFHGGFLTQFYPYAGSTSFAGQKSITEKSISSLDWKGVRLGSTAKPVETSDKVWTTPREVSAPVLEVGVPLPDSPQKQTEHFLFYRGVGHLDSPLIVAPNGSGKKGAMEMYSPYMKGNGIEDIASAWIVDIRSDGSCAARHIEDHIVATVTETHATFVIKDLHAWAAVSGFNVFTGFSAAFADSDFSTDNLAKLKASMQAALVKEGLYDDEATAMLKTWELSYFKSPGLRFFYIVPRAWVDKVLPLKITGAPTEITRVMVGRIELITDAQKAALARLAAGPCPNLGAVKEAALNALQNGKLPKDVVDAFYRGEKPLGELGIAIPPLVQDYLSLGRFRDALIVREQKLHPSAALTQFITDNQLASPAN